MGDRELVRDILRKLEGMGVGFDFSCPGYGMVSVKPAEIENALFSEAKFPLQHILLGLSDAEYERYLSWFHGGRLCRGKLRSGKPCRNSVWIEPRDAKLLDELAYCEKHRKERELEG
jgi:hypothetical protein